VTNEEFIDSQFHHLLSERIFYSDSQAFCFHPLRKFSVAIEATCVPRPYLCHHWQILVHERLFLSDLEMWQSDGAKSGLCGWRVWRNLNLSFLIASTVAAAECGRAFSWIKITPIG
jgi:hypothetical protein